MVRKVFKHDVLKIIPREALPDDVTMSHCQFVLALKTNDNEERWLACETDAIRPTPLSDYAPTVQSLVIFLILTMA